MVLGAPGSGKTVFAVHLLLELLAAVPPAPLPGGRPPRVPVLLSLPAWPAPAADGPVLSAHFDGWVAGHLVRTYRLAEPVAAALVAGGWLLPVLDGLDEMDTEAGADGGLPPRAARVARALNQDPGTGLRPVVLACREQRYRQLAAGVGEQPGADPVLDDATAVTVQPLTPAQVTGYLAYRFPGGACGLEARWEPVGAALAADPAGALAGALGTPWRLFLAVTGYHAGHTRPAELVDIAATRPGELDGHLLGRLVPAAVGLHPRAGGSHYQPGEVTRGLATLARYLARQQAHGGSGTDLYINEVWRAAGLWAPRYLHAALVATPWACMFLVFLLLVTAGPEGAVLDLLRDPPPRSNGLLVGGLFWIIAFAIVLLDSVAIALRQSSQLLRANLRRLRHPGVVEMLMLPVGFTAGLTNGLTYGLLAGLSVGLVVIAGVLMYALIKVIEAPQAVDRPSTLLREDLTFKLTLGLLLGLTIGPIFGFTFEPLFGNTVGLILGLTGGLALGLAASVWPRFAITSAILARRGAIPGSLHGFLDWAYAAGLLRLSGTAFQFRHIEFQRWAEGQTSEGP